MSARCECRASAELIRAVHAYRRDDAAVAAREHAGADAGIEERELAHSLNLLRETVRAELSLPRRTDSFYSEDAVHGATLMALRLVGEEVPDAR